METKKAVIPVKGMTCVNCAAAIQKDISKLVGVKNANVNYANEKAVIEFDPASTGLKQFISSIHESGYQAVTERVTVPVIDLDVSRVPELEKTASAIDGVLKASVNATAGTVEIEYVPGQIGLRDIRRAIEREGFRLPEQVEGRSALDIEKEARERELSELRTKLMVSAALSVLIFIGSMQDMIPGLSLLPRRTMWYILFALTTPVQFWAGTALLPECLGVAQARQHEHEHTRRRGHKFGLRLQRGAHVLSRTAGSSCEPRRRLLRHFGGDHHADPVR